MLYSNNTFQEKGHYQHIQSKSSYNQRFHSFNLTFRFYRKKNKISKAKINEKAEIESPIGSPK